MRLGLLYSHLMGGCNKRVRLGLYYLSRNTIAQNVGYEVKPPKEKKKKKKGTRRSDAIGLLLR